MCDSASGAGREHGLDHLISELRRLAAAYVLVRGRTLNVTNEVGELEAARRLGLTLMTERDTGHDAIGKDGARVCIRSRVVPDIADPGPICINGLKIGASWDAVVLVLLDPQYELLSIYRAERADLQRAMSASRNRKPSAKPAFSINTFVKCGRKVWPES